MDKLDVLVDIMSFDVNDIKKCRSLMEGMSSDELINLNNRLRKLLDECSQAKKLAILKEEQNG